MEKEDIQDKRIGAVLGNDEQHVSEETVKRFCEYLKHNLKFPFEVTGIEEFQWEGYYTFGPGTEEEHTKLKNTRASHNDTFELLGFDNDTDEEYGIIARVRRLSDRKQFFLPLAELEATDKKSENYQLLDDYAVWFANNR